MDAFVWKAAFNSRNDLIKYGENSLMLFALQMFFRIDDIESIATTSLTGSNDKKADMVYIDEEQGVAVIAQSIIYADDTPITAQENKANDLNTAMSWLLSMEMKDVPKDIEPHASALRKLISEGKINKIIIWFVHNRRQSAIIGKALKSVENTCSALLKSFFTGQNVEVMATEVGANLLESWYRTLSIPILVDNPIKFKVSSGYEIQGKTWSSFVTAIPTKWLYELYKTYGVNLFSANVRDYLGSRETDRNINQGIKDSIEHDPASFWVYNNGLTALVNNFSFDKDQDGLNLEITGISIVNGAQTTGVIGTLQNEPSSEALVPIRFIKCDNQDVIKNIVRFNNSQNKINPSDYRSSDEIQLKITDQFTRFTDVVYQSRRGGADDVIRRPAGLLTSVVAGQALAAFHGHPEVAYHGKNKIWESDALYSSIFNSHTSASHIVLCVSLLRNIQQSKLLLMDSHSKGKIVAADEKVLTYLRLRGSDYLLISAMSEALEVILKKPVANKFNLHFADLSMDLAINNWKPVVDSCVKLSTQLSSGLQDGLGSKDKVKKAIDSFVALVNATYDFNKEVFTNFTGKIII